MGTAVLTGGSSTGAAAAAPVTALTLPNNGTGTYKPTNISQNTLADEQINSPSSGDAAGWTFQLTDTWQAGDTIAITLAPKSGADCETPYPQGVNSSLDDPANYVGFANFAPGNKNDIVGPAVYAITDGETAPAFTETESDASGDTTDPIDCSDQGATTENDGLGSTTTTTYSTLDLTFTNSGEGDGSTITVNVGVAGSLDVGGSFIDGSIAVPTLLNVGFGASTGAITATGQYVPNSSGDVGTFDSDLPATSPANPVVTVASPATVVGETPAANVPASGLQRNTQTDTIGGSISNFTITEGPANSLPPTNDDETSNLNPPVVQNPALVAGDNHIQDAPKPGDVCVVIDNHDGSGIYWGNVAHSAWTVVPGASTSSYSAQAGAPSVEGSNSTILQLPVTNTSNVANTVWTASGLSLAGTATADGPVWAYVYWISPGSAGAADTDTCADVSPTTSLDEGGTDGFTTDADYDGDYQLGYVQLTTVSELANSVYGADADATSTQAIEHQFNPASDSCVSNEFPHFSFGPSIFLATDADYHDALGADYAAGTIDSGVLLTNPNALEAQTLDAIREEGVSTVFVAGGPLAISNAVTTQLQNTPTYYCGGTAVRVDPVTNQTEDLNVIRVYGQTANDTDEQMAEYIGAQPIDQLQPFAEYGSTDPFNDTTGENSTTYAPSSAVNTALLVTDSGWQDAVDASVPGYNDQLPVITTDVAGLTTQAQDTIYNDHIGQVIVVGGPLAVSDNVINQLNAQGVGAVRIAGADASETSTQLASFELARTDGITYQEAGPFGNGYDNEDQQWLHYVARTAGVTDTEATDETDAHVVLLARGDNYADALSAAVLSIHNGLYRDGDLIQFPLVLTETSTSLGTPVTTFLNNAGLAISGLAGQAPAFGLFDTDSSGDQNFNNSSSVYTIQPVGGPLALTSSVLTAAVAAVTAG